MYRLDLTGFGFGPITSELVFVVLCIMGMAAILTLVAYGAEKWADRKLNQANALTRKIKSYLKKLDTYDDCLNDPAFCKSLDDETLTLFLLDRQHHIAEIDYLIAERDKYEGA